MKKFNIFIILCCIISCDKETQPKTDFVERVIDIAIEVSNNKYVEFPNIYDTLVQNIPKDENEKLIIVEKLKKKGFVVSHSGRGNHPLGPRIIDFTLTKLNCECGVEKIYYSSPVDSIYTATERIRCRKIKKAN